MANIDGKALNALAEIGNDGAITKSDLGLGNVDNTSDANKPISTAQKAELDAIKENVLLNSNEITQIENIINSMNPNQEARTTVTGVDTISLPKTAANTGMQVQLFGQSARNLVVNGDFRNGMTGWLMLGAPNTMTITDKLILNGTANASSGIYQDIAASLEDKLYIAINSTNEGSTFPGLRSYDFGTTNNSQSLGLSNSVNSVITTSKIGGIRFYIQQTGGSTYTNATIDNVRLINLTATYGAGNEPTKEQCDLLFANYFEGTDNVLGTGRVRSVGKNTVTSEALQSGIGKSINTSYSWVDLASARSIDYIEISPNTNYRISGINLNRLRRAYYDKNKVFISGVDRAETTTYATLPFGPTPANAKYTRILIAVGIDPSNVMIEKETGVATTYEPYRQSAIYLQSPELRSNGLIKDEIRKGTNGYELVKRVGVGTLGSELITNVADREFSSDTGFWTKGTGVTINDAGSGTAYIPSLQALYKANLAIAGKVYRIQFTIISGAIGLSVGGFALDFYSTGIKTVYWKAANNGSFSFQGRSDSVIDNVSFKELDMTDGALTGTTATELGSNIHYTLATPTITPIAHAGLLNSNSNGTTYFEPVVADAGVYSTSLAIQATDYPIASFESIRKYANGTYTELSLTSGLTIAPDGLSFTHTGLTAGDLVMFTYNYNKESIGRSMTLTHYDNRYVIADTANSKVYRWTISSTNGVPSIVLTEV